MSSEPYVVVPLTLEQRIERLEKQGGTFECGSEIIYDAPPDINDCLHRQPFARWKYNPYTIWRCACGSYQMVGNFGFSGTMTDAQVAGARAAGVIPS